MGALVVVGDGPEVLNICSGGFLLDAAFSPQRLSELAKMDGAIILAGGRQPHRPRQRPPRAQPERARRARRAPATAPPSGWPARSTCRSSRSPRTWPSIAVYVGPVKHVLETIPRLLNRANQALQTLERYKIRLDEASAALSTLEVEDLVTVRDVVAVLQRTEMVRRIAEEIEIYIVELGVDGRLVRLQLDELMGGVEDDRRLVLQDYFHEAPTGTVDEALDALADLEHRRPARPRARCRRVAAPARRTSTSSPDLQPRGYRLLAKVPRLPEASRSSASSTASAASRRSCGPRSTTSTTSQGVGETRARAIKDGLSRSPRRASSTATPDLTRLAAQLGRARRASSAPTSLR